MPSPDQHADERPGSLFAYGTLLPGEPRWHHLAPYVLDEGVDDRVVGRLYDTGQGYPAARFGESGVLHGARFELRRDRVDDALRELDEVEGAVAGLYRRVTVTTDAGVRAYAYEYGGGLDLRPIPSGSWRSRR